MSINADKFIEVEEQSSVSTPATGKGRFFFKDDGLPYTLNDAGEEIQVGAGGAGSSKDINQSTHGFTVGTVLRYANQSGETGYVKSQADDAENADVIGVVSEVVDVDNFKISYSGFITLAGQSFTAGQVMFLSDATAGLLTSTEPTDIGAVSKPMFIPVSATTGYFFNWRGSVIAGGGGGGGDSTITGEVKMWVTDTAPDGYLLADGSAVSQTTYADLYAVIGTTFGDPGGGNFNIPDMRGRTPLGKDNMGGSSANRVTNAQADSVGGSEGAESHTLSLAESPAHIHGAATVTSGGQPYSCIKADSYQNSDPGGYAINTSSKGSGSSHNNMTPYLTLNYIIKT